MAKRFKVSTIFDAVNRISKPMSKMRRSVSKFTRLSIKRFAKLGHSVKKVGAFMGKSLAVGVGLAGAAMGAAIFKTAKMGDEAAKTSRRLGITAESLQELRFAADRQGVSASVLDSSFTALQKRVGELKDESGTLFGFLKKTGQTAFIEQLKLAKDTEEAFGLITQKAGEIKDPFKKAAFVVAAFSRSGIEMSSFMEIGQAEIAKLRLEAVKYGAVISNEAAAKSELFIDSLTNLKSSLDGIGKTFSNKVIPFLTTAMQRFADFWALNKNIIGAGMDNFLLVIGDTFKKIKDPVVTLFGVTKQLFSAFSEAVGSILPEFNTESMSFADTINILIGALKFLAEIGVKAFKFVTSISPFLKPFLAVLLASQGILLTIAIATKSWAVVQGILNLIMSANPLSLVIIAIAALVAGIVLLIDNWDFVVFAFKNGVDRIWNFLSGLLDNPFIAAAGVIFAPFIAIPALIVKHWEPISQFFVDMWDQIGEIFSKGIDFVMGLVEPFKSTISGIGNFISGAFGALGTAFGQNDTDESAENATETGRPGSPGSPQVITQAAQLKRSIEETRETSSAELLIRDQTGRAELRRSGNSPGINIIMAKSGAF